MNNIYPLQGVRKGKALRSVLINAGLWNVKRLSEDSGTDPEEVMAVLFNQVVSAQTIYRLVSVINNMQGAGRWMID